MRSRLPRLSFAAASSWRFGMSGVNLMLPAASTLLDTVTMAARATILPDGVSTVTSRLLQLTRLAGVDSASGTCSPSLAISVPMPCRQSERGIAVLRAGLVDRGDVFQILAGETGAEHEFRRPRPDAEVLRQHGRASDVGLAAGGFVDGAVGAHHGGEKFLGFSGPRIAAADADFLADRRGRDVKPRGARELDHRVGVGIVHPPRAAIERHAECRGIGEAAAADLARGLHHDDPAVRRHDAPRRRICRQRRRRSRQCRHRAAAARPMRGRRGPAPPQGPRPPTGNPGASLSCHGFRNF